MNLDNAICRGQQLAAGQARRAHSAAEVARNWAAKTGYYDVGANRLRTLVVAIGHDLSPQERASLISATLDAHPHAVVCDREIRCPVIVGRRLHGTWNRPNGLFTRSHPQYRPLALTDANLAIVRS